VVTVLSGESVETALLTAAHHGGLLVLGCRFADGHMFSRLGPTTSGLLHRSPCPVLVVGHPRNLSTAPTEDAESVRLAAQPGN